MNKEHRTAKNWSALFLGVWVSFYMLYPSWALPISVEKRFLVYVSLMAYFVINAIMLYNWTKSLEYESVPGLSIVREVKKIKENKPLMFFLIIFALLHIYPLGFSGFEYHGDSAYHATVPLTLSEVASGFTKNLIGVSFLNLTRILILCLILLVLIKKYVAGLKQVFHDKLIVLWLGGLFASLLYFWFLKDIGFMQGLTRFPPVGKILYLFSYSIFGINEFAPRVIQLTFAVLTAIYVFKIAEIYLGKEAALYAAGLLLFFPNFFYWSAKTSLACGTVFFITAASFYFLQSIKNASPTDRLKCIFLAAMGSLYHHILIIIIPIFGVTLLWDKSWKRNKLYSAKEMFKFGWFCVVPILPMLLTVYIFADMYKLRSFDFVASNWLSAGIVTTYLFQMPQQIGYALFAIFIIAFVLILLKKDATVLDRYLIVWLIAHYIIITSDGYMLIHPEGLARHAFYFYPVVSVMIAKFMVTFIKNVKIRKALFVMFLIYLSLSCTVMVLSPIEDRYAVYKHSRSNPDRLYDPALKYIEQHLPEDSLIFAPVGSNYFKFYIYKHNVGVKWSSGQEGKDYRKISHFLRYCRRKRFDYILEPYGDLNKREFKLVKSFKDDNNQLYLWRVGKR